MHDEATEEEASGGLVWQVDRDGYEIVTGVPIDGIPRLDFRADFWRSEERERLVGLRGVIRPRGGEVRTYRPMTDKPGLARRLADMYDYEDHATGKHRLSIDSYRRLKDVRRRLNVVRGKLANKDGKAVDEHHKLVGKHAKLLAEERGLAGRSAIPSDEDILKFVGKYGLLVPGDKMLVEDLVTLSMYLRVFAETLEAGEHDGASELFNDRVLPAMTVRLGSDAGRGSPSSRWTMEPVPVDLASAAWMQMAQELTQGRRLAKCAAPDCSEWFPARSNKLYCNNRCKKAAWNHAQKP